MKKWLTLSFVFFVVNNLFAQGGNGNSSNVITCSDFHISRPLRDIVKDYPAGELIIYKDEESKDRTHRKPQKFPLTVKDGPQYGNDLSSVQKEMGTVPGRAPITNWAGQTASGFRPYDPSGAVGPLHYVQMINSTTFKVYDKVTGTVSLTAILGTLWSPATPNSGDPIVLYDKAADRWFLAQFGTAGNAMYIAISTTGDPTGTYYTYTFTSPQFPDYLKFSVWADGYYMTSNQTQKVFAFDRTAMLAGTAGSRAVYTNFSPPQGTGFFVPLPGDASDGTLPSYGTPCPIFSYSDNGWGASYSDAVNIYQMAVNWIPVTPTATITLAGNIPTAVFDASYDASWNDVIQPITAQKLDGIGGVCMYRAQWKSWAGYNSVLLNWGVKINASQRSIKWCEMRQDQSTGVWSVYQEGIYSPDASTRWMGSIAMDQNGSIGLCYMKTEAATTTYPGLYYTGRRTCDPLGTLPVAETMVIAGTGYQTGTNRVGDYGQVVLDPDGSTFWYTGEYMGGTSGGSAARTQIFSFQITPCGNNAFVNISLTGGTNPQCPGTSTTFTATPTNGGTTPAYQWKVNGVNVGTNSATYTTSSLTNGQIVTCVMTSNMVGVTGNPATSNAITMVVNTVVTPSVSIALTTGTNPSCAGTPITFTATAVNGGAAPSYQWKVDGVNTGTNSATFSTSALTNGQIVSCVMTSNALCVSSATATSNSITMTITPVANPTVTIAQTAGTNPLCTGASATFTATVLNAISTVYQWKVDGVNSGSNSSTFTPVSLTTGQIISCDITSTPTCASFTSATIGTGTNLNATTSDLGVAYPTYYGSGRQQYLIKASELIAAGYSAGNINSIGFNVGGTTGDPATLLGYTIKMAHSAVTVTTTTFQAPVFTTVFGPVNYTPTLNSINTHTLISPFVWNGTSNVIIDICFSNQVVGVTAYQNYQTTSSFFSTTYYQVDGATSTACTQATGTRGSMRPNMIFSRGITSVNASSNAITMTVSNCSVSANVVVFIEGFYIGSSTMKAVLFNSGLSSDPTACDSINVDLYDGSAPFPFVESAKGLLHTNGTAQVQFSAGTLNRLYYISVRHRNALETWSSVPVMMVNNVTYNFTTAQNKSYGNNSVNLGAGVYGMYSGDVNQSQLIDLTDLQLLETATGLFLNGYQVDDLTGDLQIESADYSLVENNLYKALLRP